MKQIKLFDPVVEKRDFDNVLKTINGTKLFFQP